MIIIYYESYRKTKLSNNNVVINVTLCHLRTFCKLLLTYNVSTRNASISRACARDA